MYSERNCKFCDCIFLPLQGNQQYCCKECRRQSDRKKDREKSKTYRAKKKSNAFKSFPSIEEIVYICEKVRMDTGKKVNYGLVSHLSECNKLNTLGVNL